jgi:hypothetical protein
MLLSFESVDRLGFDDTENAGQPTTLARARVARHLANNGGSQHQTNYTPRCSGSKHRSLARVVALNALIGNKKITLFFRAGNGFQLPFYRESAWS